MWEWFICALASALCTEEPSEVLHFRVEILKEMSAKALTVLRVYLCVMAVQKNS